MNSGKISSNRQNSVPLTLRHLFMFLVLFLFHDFQLFFFIMTMILSELPDGVPRCFARGFGRRGAQGSNPPLVFAHPPLR